MQTVSAFFTAATKAVMRTGLASKVEIAWDGTNWVDETEYLISFEYTVQIEKPGDELLPAGETNAAMVTLRNPGRFSWRRADKPLFAYIGGDGGMFGIKVRLWQGWAYPNVLLPELVQVFTGVIFNWEGDSQVTLHLYDAGMPYIQHKISTVIHEGLRADEWIAELAYQAGISTVRLVEDAAVAEKDQSGTIVLDPGIAPIAYAWCDDEGIVSEMMKTARADCGRLYWDQLGRLRFENAIHWATAVHQTVVWDFTENTYLTPSADLATGDLSTKITVEWAARVENEEQVIYTLDKLRTILPGETISFEARFDNPVMSIVTPVNHKDYRIHGAGIDISSHITVVLAETYAQRCVVYIHNSHTTMAARFSFFQLRGYPLTGGPTKQVKVAVSPSALPTGMVREQSVRGNPYVQTEVQAQILADSLAGRQRALHSSFSLTGVPGVPHLEVGDRVSFTNLREFSPPTIYGYVTRLNGKVSPSGFWMDLTILDASGLYDSTDIFQIGLHEIGEGRRVWY